MSSRSGMAKGVPSGSVFHLFAHGSRMMASESCCGVAVMGVWMDILCEAMVEMARLRVSSPHCPLMM